MHLLKQCSKPKANTKKRIKYNPLGSLQAYKEAEHGENVMINEFFNPIQRSNTDGRTSAAKSDNMFNMQG